MDYNKEIFKYQDYRKFLKDVIEDKKKKNSKYSIRHFAKMVDFKSHSFVHNIINGKSNISQESADKIINYLKLKGLSKKYFNALYMLNQSKNDVERELYSDLIMQYSVQHSKKKINIDNINYFLSPIHAIIREIVTDEKFTGNLNDVVDILDDKISLKAVEKSLFLLENLNLIKKSVDGRYVMLNSIVSTKSVAPNIIKNLSKTLHKKGIEALDKYSINERYITGNIVKLSKKNYNEIQKKIEEIEKLALNLYNEDEEEKNRVYALNFQLFPLTKEID